MERKFKKEISRETLSKFFNVSAQTVSNWKNNTHGKRKLYDAILEYYKKENDVR